MKIPKKYIHQSGKNKGCLKKSLLQTGEDKGTYQIGDPHPSVNGLFYMCWNRGEDWADLPKINNFRAKRSNYFRSDAGKLCRKKYNQSERGRETKRMHQIKWASTDKGKAYYIKFCESGKRSEVLRKYDSSEKARVNSRNKCAKRRAKTNKSQVKLKPYQNEIIKNFYEYSVRLKNKLGIEFHVDHIVPLSLGGLHHPSNLQVVPAVWNLRKKNNNTNLWLPNGL